MRNPIELSRFASASAFAPLVREPLSASRVECHSLRAGIAFAFAEELEMLRSRSAFPNSFFRLPDWLAAKPAPPGWVARIILLRTEGGIEAAVSLREKVVCGVATGYFRGNDDTGEPLIVCAAGHETVLLCRTVDLLLRKRRAFLVLLGRLSASAAEKSCFPGWRVRSITSSVHWRLALETSWDATLATLGHRTRRNLRLALRRVEKKGWQVRNSMTADEALMAVHELAGGSTHPYSPELGALRLRLVTETAGCLAMGLQDSNGKWLSCIMGRHVGDVIEVFWQSNATGYASDSLCMTMRAVFLREEIERGTREVRYLGGTSALMQHCCTASDSRQTSAGRRGLRLLLTQLLFRTSLISIAHPLRRHFQR